MKQFWIVSGLVVAALGASALIVGGGMWSGQHDAPAAAHDMPWQVQALPGGGSQVLGLTLGEASPGRSTLGDKRFLMLRNHGLLVASRTIADAFLNMYLFESTCRIQLAAQSGGAALTEVDPGIMSGVSRASKVQTGGQGGNFVWPALIRKLDRVDPNYKT